MLEQNLASQGVIQSRGYFTISNSKEITIVDGKTNLPVSRMVINKEDIFKLQCEILQGPTTESHHPQLVSY